MTKIEKHLEDKTYEHNDIKVRVRINYDAGTIDLLDQGGGTKKWIFAGRSLEYMQGWQNILDAMKHAITLASADLKKHNDAKERERIARERRIAKAIAEEKGL